METADVQRRVEGLRKDANDKSRKIMVDINAIKEEFIWLLVLQAIANGASNAQELAREALKTLPIDTD